VSCASMALRLDSNVRDPIPYYMLMLDRVRKLAEEFDVLHYRPVSFSAFCPDGRSDGDHSSRPTRPSRSQAALYRI
jgi:hypothetical protein